MYGYSGGCQMFLSLCNRYIDRRIQPKKCNRWIYAESCTGKQTYYRKPRKALILVSVGWKFAEQLLSLCVLCPYPHSRRESLATPDAKAWLIPGSSVRFYRDRLRFFAATSCPIRRAYSSKNNHGHRFARINFFYCLRANRVGRRPSGTRVFPLEQILDAAVFAHLQASQSVGFVEHPVVFQFLGHA